MKKALIIGVNGQDGHCLSHFLIGQGYEVYGLYRHSSKHILERAKDLDKRVRLIEGDITDSSSLSRIIREVRPNEIYNFSAHSSIDACKNQPIAAAEINALGVLRLLEAIELIDPKIRFFQASSSEMFGKAREWPQNEETAFSPRNLYGVAKLFGHFAVKNYRESRGVYACSGILYNHESVFRGLEFVTRKVTNTVAKIEIGKMDFLEIGNIDAKRDWGYAPDYVEAMWRMLQQEKPDDYVLSTGDLHTVREFIEEAFGFFNKRITWEGQGVDEIGKCNGKTVVRINPKFYRPLEDFILVGDSSKARKVLGWQPKTPFREIVRTMVEADFEKLKKEDPK